MVKNGSPYMDLPDAGTFKGGLMQHVTEEEIIDTRKKIPIKLTPGNATKEDIRLNAKYRQRLSDSTIERYFRYAFNVMAGSPVPYNPMKPDYEQFVRHMDYREEYEKATREALRHARDATQMFNYAFGLPKYQYNLPSRGPKKTLIIPFPEIVREFWHYQYPVDPYSRRLYQYMFFFGFLVGLRAPNELVELKTSNIIFNPNGSATVTIVEPKKNYSERTLILPAEIATSRQQKSLLQWMTSWRPKTDADELFVREDGRPLNIRSIGHELSRNGKLVWEHYHPYVMRHWAAIARIIDTKIDGGKFDSEVIMDWLGHDEPSTTRVYVKHAAQYYNVASYSWIRSVLRHRREFVEDNAGSVMVTNRLFGEQLKASSPVKHFKSLRAHTYLPGETDFNYSMFDGLVDNSSLCPSFFPSFFIAGVVA